MNEAYEFPRVYSRIETRISQTFAIPIRIGKTASLLAADIYIRSINITPIGTRNNRAPNRSDYTRRDKSVELQIERSRAWRKLRSVTHRSVQSSVCHNWSTLCDEGAWGRKRKMTWDPIGLLSRCCSVGLIFSRFRDIRHYDGTLHGQRKHFILSLYRSTCRENIARISRIKNYLDTGNYNAVVLLLK